MGFMDEVMGEVETEQQQGEEGKNKDGEDKGAGEGGKTGSEGKKRMHTYSPEFVSKYGERKD